MSYNYAPLQSTATRLIEKFGRDLTFARQTQGAYNPATGQTSNTGSTFTKKCVVSDFSDMSNTTQGVEVMGDVKLLALNGDYVVDDTVTIDGSVYRVVDVKEIKPSETQMYCELRVRK